MVIIVTHYTFLFSLNIKKAPKIEHTKIFYYLHIPHDNNVFQN